MNFKQFGRTAQLFDVSTAVIGKRVNANGTETNADMAYSDYIDVQGVSKLTVSHKPAITNFYFYEEKTPAALSYVNGYTADVPVNAKFCRINLSVGDVNVTMLNTGDTALPYEPYGSAWHEIPHYIHNTSTDTITTLPADIYANDTTATVGLKGQMVQSSTPTPDNPITPSECGELDRQTVDVTYSYGGYNREIKTGGIADAIKNLTPAKWTFTWDFQSNATQSFKNRMRIYVDGTNRMEISNGSTATITDELLNAIRNAYAYSVMLYYGQDNSDGYFKDFVIDAGYKIPILNNSQTTNVYLGEVQSTRRIKKLVLTGEETWASYTSIADCYRLSIASEQGVTGQGICSHYAIVGTTSQLTDGTFVSGQNYSYFKDISAQNLDGWKTYLAQQYAAGTPVTVWYVLATPETAVINEPIRKIGDYADTISGITIPTIAGANTIDVDTTLKPSEVSVNYHGWHPVQSVHEHENGAWD